MNNARLLIENVAQGISNCEAWSATTEHVKLSAVRDHAADYWLRTQIIETTVVTLKGVRHVALQQPLKVTVWVYHVSAPLLNVYSMIVSIVWSILCQIRICLRLALTRDVLSKASSAHMEEITHGGRYADIDRTCHAESEREDVLRIVPS